MTRVCHITTVHEVEDVRIFLKECKSLAAYGYDTHLIACGDQSYTKLGVQIHAIGPKKKTRIARIFSAAHDAYLTAESVQAEIYHLHDPELLPYGLLLRSRGKKVIYDAHEDSPRDIVTKEWIPLYLRKFVSKVFERFENYCARKLNAVISATPHIEKRFSSMNPNSITVNNYPSVDDFCEPSTHSSFLKSSRPYACYVGGITPIRGIYQMIAGLNKTNIQLLLAGRFCDGPLFRECTKLPGWDQVKYLGHVAREELSVVYGKSFLGFILFLPEENHIHSQPNKMFEYMAAGIPIVASNFPLWKSLIEGHGCGVCIDPNDHSQIAEAVITLDGDRDCAREMGKRGLNAVKEKFNWEREEKSLIELYRKLESARPM